MKNLLLSFLLLWIAACGKKPVVLPKAPEPKTYTVAEAVPATPQSTSGIHFVDITQSAGIHFTHESGLSSKKYMPETMGSGCGLFDYEGDGDLDIFLVNARFIIQKPTLDQPPIQALYRNDGNGQFTDVTQAAGLNVCLYGMGCTIADYDGDGDEDLFLTAALDGNRLFRNNGDGTFTDVTAASGLQSPTWKDEAGRELPVWSTSAMFFDYNQDGWLDLFVCNYIQWSVENDIYTTRVGLGKSFTVPILYKGQSSLLYRNRGDGTFEEVTPKAGLWNPEAKSLGVATCDLNDDGFLDLIIANDSQPNLLYLNTGSGTFKEVGMDAGIAYDENGRARAGMGIDAAYFFNDKRAAVAIGNFSHEPISFYCQERSLFFVDDSGKTRLSRPSLLTLKFGLAFLDYDLDGWLDLAVANGHIEPEIQKVEQEVTYKQSPQMFRNQEGQRFQDVTDELGEEFHRPIVGRGLAYGDIDGDGDLDLLFTECGGKPRLMKNEIPHKKHHFIRFHLIGKTPNTDAIGAKMILTQGNRMQTRMVRTGSSYLSQSETTLTFGLGEQTNIDHLQIRWPQGALQDFSLQEIQNFPIDTTITLHEPVIKNES